MNSCYGLDKVSYYIESSDSDLDKVLVTYSQVESINSNFIMWLFKPFYFIVIIIGLLFD